MEAVKAFNDELSALYETKPPISKAKMTSITRTAIKAIKFYKHVVQSVEKFIQKCKPEYKVPGLYVIDSIVRQSRHQFGTEKDVFAPRFARNLTQTFSHLFSCAPEDKCKVIRVLNLWQKNGVFDADTINPLFDLADPSHPIHSEQANVASNGLSAKKTPSATNTPLTRTTPNSIKTPSSTTKPDTTTPSWISGNDSTPAANSSVLNMLQPSLVDSSMLQQLQQLHNILLNQTSQQSADGHQHSSTPVKRDRDSGEQVKFDKKLLDFDYGDDEDDDGKTSPQQAPAAQQNTQAAAALDSLGSILGNPEVLRQLHNLQLHLNQQQVRQQQTDMEEKLRKLQQMKQQEEEFDKHLAQTLPSLPFANECDFKLNITAESSTQQAMLAMGGGTTGAALPNLKNLDTSQPPPGYPHLHGLANKSPLEDGERPNSDNDERQHGIRNWVSEAMLRSQNLNRQQQSGAGGGGGGGGGESGAAVVVIDSESPSDSPGRKRQRSSRYSRSSSRSRSRRRSRSRSRRRRSRSFDRDYDRDDRDKTRSKDSVRDRQRKRKGLPPLRKNHLSVCSTTLWVGHLSRLVQQDELSNTFGEYGDIVSIDLIPPRGCAFICMNRRQDANRALQHLKHHKMQQKAITLAWAPGKGMKGKEWKDYWEVEQGVSYIPWSKITPQTDFDLLEEGGMFDEESVPEWLKLKLESSKQQKQSEQKSNQFDDPRRPTSSIDTHSQDDTTMNEDDSSKDQPTDMDTVPTAVAPVVSAPPPGLPPGFIPLPEGPQPPEAPPHLKPPGPLPPPPLGLPPVGMMPPFGLPNMPRLMGPMGMPMGPGLMPNVPLGVPPPGLISSPLIHQQMMQRLPQPVNSPFNPPPPGVGLMSGPPPPLSQIPLPGADKGGPKVGLAPPPVSAASDLSAAFTDPLLQMPFSLPPQLQLAPQNALAGPNLRQPSPQQAKIMPPKQGDSSQSDNDKKDDNQMLSFSHPPPNFPNLGNLNIPPPTSNSASTSTTQNKEGDHMRIDDKEDRDSRDKGGKKDNRERERDRERDYRGGRGRERDYRDRDRDYRGRDRGDYRSRDRDRRDRDSRRSRDKDDEDSRHDDKKEGGGRKSEDRGKDRERDRDRGDRDRGDRSRDRDRDRERDRDRRSSRGGGGRWSDRDNKRKDERSMSEEKNSWNSSQDNSQNQQDRNDGFNNNNNNVNNNNHDSSRHNMMDMHQIPHPDGGPPKGGPHGPPTGPQHGPPAVGPPHGPPRGMGPPPGPMGMMMGDGPRPPFGPGGPPPIMFGGPRGGPPGGGGPPVDMFNDRGGGAPPPGMVDPDGFDIMGIPPHMHHGDDGGGFGGPPPPVDMFADGPPPMDGGGGPFGGPPPRGVFGGGPGQDRIRIEFFPRGRGMRPDFGPRMMGRGGPMGPMFSPRGPGPRSPMRGPRPGVWMENQGGPHPPGPPGGPGFPPRGFMTPPGGPGGPPGPPLGGPGGDGPPPSDDFNPQRNIMRGPMRGGRFQARADRRSSRWSTTSPNGGEEEHDERKPEESEKKMGGEEGQEKVEEKKVEKKMSPEQTPMETEQTVKNIEPDVEKPPAMEVDVPKMEENKAHVTMESSKEEVVVNRPEPSVCKSEDASVSEDKGHVRKEEENTRNIYEERSGEASSRNEELTKSSTGSANEAMSESRQEKSSFEAEKEPVIIPERRVSVGQLEEVKEFVAREEPTEPREVSKQEASEPMVIPPTSDSQISSRTIDNVEPSLDNSSKVEPVECSTGESAAPEESS